jgi:hypothetical protein
MANEPTGQHSEGHDSASLVLIELILGDLLRQLSFPITPNHTHGLKGLRMGEESFEGHSQTGNSTTISGKILEPGRGMVL